MKKIISLILALLLCCASAAAFAETIEVEEMLLDNGLCFVAPVGWTQLELDAEDYEEGYVMMTIDIATNRGMAVVMEEGDPELTCDALAQELASDPEFAGAQVITNEHGAELVLYALADQTMISYCILDAAGDMIVFSFLNVEDERISSDRALLELVDTCMQNTYFDEELIADENGADDDADAAQAVVAGEIALEMMYFEEGPVFPIPSDWEEVALDDEDIADGCVAAYAEENTGRNMLIMANEIGQITTADLADLLTGDEDYATVRLMTNNHGTDLILFVSADLSTGGYCFMGEDGWMYNFLFGLEDGSVMTEDEGLAQLVQDCMANTYCED